MGWPKVFVVLFFVPPLQLINSGVVLQMQCVQFVMSLNTSFVVGWCGCSLLCNKAAILRDKIRGMLCRL